MAPLNNKNYLNLLGYIINVFFTFFAPSIFNLKGPEELSDTYQTLVTPTGFIFSIWGVIFISQGIFTIVQLLEKYRSLEVVQQGVSYWYFVCCIAQSAWTVLFGIEQIFLSTVAMLIILYSLETIVMSQSKSTVGTAGFWLLKFPFEIHFAWICAASVLNVNVWFISIGAGAILQQIFAYLGLIILVVVAYVSLFIPMPKYTIPSVFTWATFGIFFELMNPKDLIVNTFSSASIMAVMYIAIILCAALLISTITIAVIEYLKNRNSSSSERTGLTSGDQVNTYNV